MRPFTQDDISERLEAVSKAFGLSMEDASFFVLHDRIDNRAYSTASHGIAMLFKDGSVRDASSGLRPPQPLCTLSVPVERHFLAYPKELPPRPTAVKG